jgi:hypothetical protein
VVLASLKAGTAHLSVAPLPVEGDLLVVKKKKATSKKNKNFIHKF